MHRLLIMYPRPQNPDAFLDYYKTRHLPAVHNLPGLLSASYGLIDDPKSDWFLTFEALFADQASLQQAVQSDHGKSLAMDIPNYSPGGACMFTHPVHPLSVR